MNSEKSLAAIAADGERSLWHYRRMLGRYRQFLHWLQLDHVAIERVLSGDDPSHASKERTLANLRVRLDREALKACGYDDAAITESLAWLRELNSRPSKEHL